MPQKGIICFGFAHLCRMKVFISRTLPDDALFRTLLESRGISVTGEPLVLLSPLPLDKIPACNWIFFSSKNAVNFFFTAYPAKDLPDVQWAAIGPGTAEALARYVGKVVFTGTGDPEATARQFEPLATGQVVLFPGARHSREGVQRLLTPAVMCISLEIYDNVPAPNPPLRTENILVFTSPLSASAYFANHGLQKKQQVIAIGKSTFATLQSIGIEQITLSAQTSEAAMAEAVLLFLG